MFIQYHECNKNPQYDIIYYNPNPNERSRVMEEMCQLLNPVSIRGYRDPNNNEEGIRTYLTWLQIYLTFTDETENPFHRTDIKLLTYNKKQRKFQ